MNHNEIQRIAAAVNMLRPEWPIPSLITFLSTDLGHRAFRDVAVAMAWIACEPETRTPKRALEAGPWWATLAGNGDRPVVVADMGDLCHTCRRTEAGCQADAVQALDKHPFKTTHQVAIERARREKHEASMPKIRERSITDAIDSGVPRSPAVKAEMATKIEQGKAAVQARGESG